jgi:hypothetical protein
MAAPPEEAVARDALADPAARDPFIALAGTLTST